MKMNAGIYTYWYGFPSTPNEGVFSNLYHTIDINAKESTVGWLQAITNDIKYWINSRIHGIFYVYMDCPDGTILISEDFMHVYLVQGITKSIGQIFLKKMNNVDKKTSYS